MTPNKQVSPAIRILRGERDASARATHLEAATRKFLVTTNERKQMSTTTNFKRVALVAVAALSLGVLSAVPSQAVASGVTITATNASLTLDSGSTTAVDQDSTTAATIDVRGLVSSDNDTLSVTFYELSRPVGSYGANVKMGVLETLTAASYVAESAIGAELDEVERLSGAATESVAAGAAFLLRDRKSVV